MSYLVGTGKGAVPWADAKGLQGGKSPQQARNYQKINRQEQINLSADQFLLSVHCTVLTNKSVAAITKMRNSVG